MKAPFLSHLIAEDAPQGDITSQAIFSQTSKRQKAELLAKENLVVSGLATLRTLQKKKFPSLSLKWFCSDGDFLPKGTLLGQISGPVTEILLAERLVLNILQRLSGIATLTRQFVDKAEGQGAMLFDTRKTIPGWRLPEKKAVRDGGACNHRLNLSDQYLIKDNHIAAAGSVTQALEAVKRHQKRCRYKRKIEIEVKTKDQFCEALSGAPDIILLDNFSVPEIRHCVRLRNHHKNQPLLEISGGVTLKNLKSYLKLGVERISIGALTHAARFVDIALDFK